MVTSNRYVELHCHSHFSLLDGTTSPYHLVQRAADVGMTALAITDHDALYAAVPLATACQQVGIRPIFGAELTVDHQHLTLLVENAQGWRNLCALISRAQHNAPKGAALLNRADLMGCTDGLIALTGCRQGAVAQALLSKDLQQAETELQWLCDYFGRTQVYIELQHHYHPDDAKRVRRLMALAHHWNLPFVATNNVHYLRPDDHRLHDVLTCIKQGLTIEQSRAIRRPNAEYYLKSYTEMAHLFGELPTALTTTLAIAERCNFDLPTGLQALPPYPVPDGQSASTYLRHLCEAALPHRYPADGGRARPLLDHELQVIEQAGLSNYFLVVWDVLDFAQGNGILAQGRGSACNSLVAYLLGISPIDPIEHHLTFERFLSAERPTTPDIDIDLQADRRDEVIQYVYERWGRERVGMACTFVRYGARSALRDLAKVLQIPEILVNQVICVLDGRSIEALRRSPEVQTLLADSPTWQQVIELAEGMANLPRHLGLHNGGMVISDGLLTERVPLEPAAYPQRSVTQWDKDMLEEAGIIKLDLLGLRMMSVLAEATDLIQTDTGKCIQWGDIRFDDPAIYDLISRADTIGIFQVESRAQAQMLPRLRPRCFADLIVAVSLIRPGPLQGNIVHPYLRRRTDEESVSYPHPALEAVLAETLGVVLYQEQVLQVTQALTGLSLGQGERLRRALSKNSPELEALARLFWRGAEARGVAPAVIEEIWHQLRAFAGYAFPKSHAASFSVIVYRSAWLKHYYPTAFYTSLLNQQPMGFWSPATLIGDAKRHHIKVLPVSLTHSAARCTAVGQALRLGFNYIDGLGEGGSQRIVQTRDRHPFRDLADFCRRTALPRRLVEHLIIAGATDSWGPRRRLLWKLGTLNYTEREFDLHFDPEDVSLPPLSDLEHVLWEREMTGVTTGPHLLAHYRPWFRQSGMKSSTALFRCSTGTTVQTAGEIVMHQAPPTAKGIHFITLEDEEGLINLVVRPDVYKECRLVIRQNLLLIVEGRIQRREQVVNVVVEWVQPFLAQLQAR